MTRRKVSVHTHRPGLPSATGSPGTQPHPLCWDPPTGKGSVICPERPRGQLTTSTRRCHGGGALGERTGRAVGPEGTGQGRPRVGGHSEHRGSGPWSPQRPRQEAGHSPSSRRRPCACRSRPGSRRGRAWGTRSKRRPPAARSGGRPGSRGAESLRQGAVRVAGRRQGPRPPSVPGPRLVCPPGVPWAPEPSLGVRPWLGRSLGGFG